MEGSTENLLEHKNETINDFDDKRYSIPCTTEYCCYLPQIVKFIILFSLVIFILSCLCSFAFVYGGMYTVLQKIGIIVNFTFVIFIEITFGWPLLFEHFRVWENHLPPVTYRLYIVPAALALIHFISSIFLSSVDLQSLIIFLLGYLPARVMVSQHGSKTWTWIDSTIVLLFWLPLNNFWNLYSMNLASPEALISPMDALSYRWWNILVAIFILTTYGTLQPMVQLGYNLIPCKKDVIILVLCVVIQAVIVLPVVLLMDLVSVPPDISFWMVSAELVKSLVSIAIPEELFYRGLILSALDRVMQRPLLSVLLGSIFYTISHVTSFPTSGVLTSVCFSLYIFFSGAIFSFAFVKSEHHLFPSIMAHCVLHFFVSTFVVIPTLPVITSVLV